MTNRSCLWIFISWFGGIPVAQAQEIKPSPVTAKTVKFEAVPASLEAATDAITQQTGIAFSIPPTLKPFKVTAPVNGPFWNVAEQLAAATNCRLRVHAGKVHFVPLAAGVSAAPSSIDGPFRTSVRQVIARHDLESGHRVTEVHLNLVWEPRFPVYLIDADAKITEAKSANGVYQADSPSSRVAASGHSHSLVVRLKNVPRDVKKLDVLSGSLNLIAAEKLLAVEFTDLTSDKPIEQTVEGVKVSLNPVKSANGQMEVAFNLEYPPSHPEFESFQTWAATNKLRLIDAAGKDVKGPDDYNTNEPGRRIAASYFFPAPKGPLDLKGWRAVYETPCPMVQQEVRFTLKNILLP